LEQESGLYSYGYDALGRLHDVKKDGNPLRTYGYDAFGNRISLEDTGRHTAYSYNNMNQLLTKVDELSEEEYTYDKRGNLSRIIMNEQIKNQYLYGSLNRLEQASNVKGEIARYQYNGLGHRVGKSVGQVEVQSHKDIQTITDKLDPMQHLQSQKLTPENQIQYTIDLTKEYHNVLQKEENSGKQIYLWDGNVTGVVDDVDMQIEFYLQDELGSPIRLVDENSSLVDTYGYDEFGQDLFQNQGRAQPFGYTGYQMDSVAETYFAQAREYKNGVGRFISKDLVKGIGVFPHTMNMYNYCFQSPMSFIDLNGAWPKWVGNVGNGIKDFWKENKNTIKTVACVAIGAVATAAVVVGTGGVALVGAAVLAGGTVGAISNSISGSGSWQNGFLGGSANGFITGVGMLYGVPLIGNGAMYAANGAGGFGGNIVTEMLNNNDKFVSERKSKAQIVFNSVGAGMVQGVVGGGLDHLTQLPKIGESSGLTEKIANIFWNYIKGVFAVGSGVSTSLLMELFKIDKSETNIIQGKMEACIE
ncbi:MAG: RHS repeat-associated core domain-containing protein, partial [Lachnospiraceae bacterium]